ncbi:hypothetical protein OVV29_36520, partial [Klebsiella pneumoniae]|nr:hypothetical protein [Klebsiella pneumoniae]
QSLALKLKLATHYVTYPALKFLTLLPVFPVLGAQMCSHGVCLSFRFPPEVRRQAQFSCL